jgi:hypothetical protein
MTKQEFEEMVYFKLLGKDEMLVMEFISYWTETDLKGKKMRFQGEKYFDVIRRFSTFEKNHKNWNPVKPDFQQKAIDKTIQAQELLNEWTNGNNKTNRLD